MLSLALVNVHGDAALRPDTAAEHHEAGVTYHLQRSLDEAAREYDQALRLDPPRTPPPEDYRRMLSLAPRVFVTAGEPFGLKDAAAILHPGRRAIAYHLFWDDDIDFPDDNDPSDHEVVWIEYDAAGALARVVTLFHGRLVAGSSTALEDARGHGGRPRIDVQWGKHGPMPAGWRQITVATEESDGDTGIPDGLTVSLEDYNARSWRKLSTERNARARPSARGALRLAGPVQWHPRGVHVVHARDRYPSAAREAIDDARLALEQREPGQAASVLQLPPEAGMARHVTRVRWHGFSPASSSTSSAGLQPCLYECRRALIGSTRDARRAGNATAVSATAANAAAAIA